MGLRPIAGAPRRWPSGPLGMPRCRLVKDCSIDSSYLHSVRSPSRPWQGASSVPNAGEQRCWICVPEATSRQLSPRGNPAPPITQSRSNNPVRSHSFLIWLGELLTEREQLESIASSFTSLPRWLSYEGSDQGCRHEFLTGEGGVGKDSDTKTHLPSKFGFGHFDRLIWECLKRYNTYMYDA